MKGRKNGGRTSKRRMTRARDIRRRNSKVMLMWVKNGTWRIESSSSEEEGVASIAIQTASSVPCLFTNLTDDENDHIPTCLMAKGKKVSTGTPSSSDDDKSSIRDN